MEAKILKKKKTTISKGQIKKTIKNVICKPDHMHWPTILEKEAKELEALLIKYHVAIPQFKKLHWKELKNIPKKERPKPPTVKKADGFIFGLSECRNLLENNQVTAIILEAAINPRTIVQPLLEVCNKNQVPVVCLTDLRKISIINFGISTSCLGVKKTELLTDIIDKIAQISSRYQPSNSNNLFQNNVKQEKENDNLNNIDMKENTMECRKEPDIASVPCFIYLYRTNKKRVFVPPNVDEVNAPKTRFIGQNFIELPNEKETKSSNTYMKMVVKRISNNPNRAKKKKCLMENKSRF